MTSATRGKRKMPSVTAATSQCSSTNEAGPAPKRTAVVLTPEEEDEEFVICLEKLVLASAEDRHFLACGHEFHKACFIQYEQSKQNPSCPICSHFYGKPCGDQPTGSISVDSHKEWLPGYEDVGSITIKYQFPGGIQGPEHYHPGKPYHGTGRSAYLPDNKEGSHVANLLQLAFACRVVFTVGTSSTTGKEDQVIWNGIHHKTSRKGGPTNFAYPDPTYLSRVREELAAAGITDSLLEKEKNSIQNFFA